MTQKHFDFQKHLLLSAIAIALKSRVYTYHLLQPHMHLGNAHGHASLSRGL